MSTVQQFVFHGDKPTYAQAYLLPVVRDVVRPLSPGTVLDFGCGNGFLLHRAFPEWQRYGLDVSLSGIDRARALLPDADLRLADLTGDLSSHPARGHCDLVVSTEVIEHIYDPRAFVENIYGFLRPGGVAIISTPYHGYLKNLSISLAGKWDHHFTVLNECGHIKFWSRATLSRLFIEAGFSVTGFHGCGRLPWLWKSMLMVFLRP